MPTLSPPAPHRNPPAHYILAEDPNALLITAQIKSLADKNARKAKAYRF